MKRQQDEDPRRQKRRPSDATTGAREAVYAYPDRAVSKSAPPTSRPSAAPARGPSARGTPPSKGKEPSKLPISDGPPDAWPPNALPANAELSLREATAYIAIGAPVHHGYKREVPHVSDEFFNLFSTTSTGDQKSSPTSGRRSSRDGNNERSRARGSRRGEDDSNGRGRHRTSSDVGPGDSADLHDSMTQFMTMNIIQGQAPTSSSLAPRYPWDTLDQPSYAFCYGSRPGTITLNHWAGLASTLPPTISLRDSGFRPRELDLTQICQRLRDIQLNGLGEDDESRMYRNLYRRLLRDPDRVFGPHRTLDKQITDLIMVLSRPDYWIDFTQPRNQVVTRFIFDTSHANHLQYERFLLQLLFSIELDLRISSPLHNTWAKEKLLLQLPPTMQWNLALARRWKDNVRIDAYGKSADQVKLRLKLKNRQIRMLRRFAGMMKWPNYTATVASLAQRDSDGSLALISSHAMAFFSGLVLPGVGITLFLPALFFFACSFSNADFVQLSQRSLSPS